MKGLQQLFPDINFDPSLFQHSMLIIKLLIINTFNEFFIIAAYYKVENRRKFFEEYAKKNNFDPLVTENWYSQPYDKIMSTKVYYLINKLFNLIIVLLLQGARRVTFYHKKNVADALTDLFPNIGFDKSKFKVLRYGINCL